MKSPTPRQRLRYATFYARRHDLARIDINGRFYGFAHADGSFSVAVTGTSDATAKLCSPGLVHAQRKHWLQPVRLLREARPIPLP